MSEADVAAPALTGFSPLKGEGLRIKIPLSASFRNVPRMTEHDVKDFRRVPFFGLPFLPWRWVTASFRVLAPSGCESAGWARKKGNKNSLRLIYCLKPFVFMTCPSRAALFLVSHFSLLPFTPLSVKYRGARDTCGVNLSTNAILKSDPCLHLLLLTFPQNNENKSAGVDL